MHETVTAVYQVLCSSQNKCSDLCAIKATALTSIWFSHEVSPKLPLWLRECTLATCVFVSAGKGKSRRVKLFVIMCVNVWVCECECECTGISQWMKVWLSFRCHLCWTSWYFPSESVSSRTAVLPPITQHFCQFYWIWQLSNKHSTLAPIAAKLDLLVWDIKLLSWSPHGGANEAGLTCPGERNPASPRYPEEACDGRWALGSIHSGFFMSLALKEYVLPNHKCCAGKYHICTDKKKSVYYHLM